MDPQEALNRYIADGDPAAFQILTTEYTALVRQVCRRYLTDDQDIEDVTQEVFIKLSRQAADIKTNVAGWLHWCASNLARNQIRTRIRRSRHDRETGTFHNWLRRPDPGSGDWGEVKPHLASAIEELPEDQKQLLREYYLEGQTMPTIGRRLGITKVAVKKRIDKGLAALRLRLCGRGLRSLATVVDRNASQKPSVPPE